MRTLTGMNSGAARVVPRWYGLVSWLVMRLPVRLSASLIAAAALALCAGAQAQAQNSSSSQSPAVQASNSQTAETNPYITTDPLANVRYNNRFDVSLGFAYQHVKAGPNVLQGANLGGLDVSGSFWLSKHWGIEGSERSVVGTSGVGQPNSLNIKGPFISEYIFAGGPEWLGPHNKHGALIAHVLVGGTYGDFTKDLLGQGASYVAFYNNQIAPAAIMGGHFDLNRSEHWVFRVTPDAVLTRYGINYGNKMTQTDINFAISVGMEYKFSKKR